MCCLKKLKKRSDSILNSGTKLEKITNQGETEYILPNLISAKDREWLFRSWRNDDNICYSFSYHPKGFTGFIDRKKCDCNLTTIVPAFYLNQSGGSFFQIHNTIDDDKCDVNAIYYELVARRLL